MGDVFGMVGNMGEFTQLRNQALLDQDMGLGEYIWIYVLVYNSWLGHPPNQDYRRPVRGRAFRPPSEMRSCSGPDQQSRRGPGGSGPDRRGRLWENEAGRPGADRNAAFPSRTAVCPRI